MCSCTSGCGCAPQSKVQAPVRGEPGPLPEITFSVNMIPAGTAPAVVISGVPPVYNVLLLLPNAFSPVFGDNVIVNMIPNGDPASGSIDSTDPLNPILTLNIPTPLNGLDGISPFTELATAYIQPAVGGLVTITGADITWAPQGAWVYIFGGGWYIVASNAFGTTQVILRNPGASDLLPYWGSSATSIPTNAAPGTTVVPTGVENQVVICGIPGLRGPAGDGGLTPELSVVYEIPTDPPASEAQAFVWYFNAEPPNVATVARAYAYDYDLSSWQGGPNFAGPGGVQAFSGTADPNVTPPSTSNIGDLYFRTAGPVYSMYQRVTSSTWSIIWGPINTFGAATNEIDHTSGPGPVTIDTGYFSTLIRANKGIVLGGLQHDDTNYDGQGEWTVQVLNEDASTIDIEYAIGEWEQDPALTIPGTIDPGASLFLKFVRNMDSGLYVFTSAFQAVTASS